MHDGSLPDLGAVIDHYDRGGFKRESLSDEIKPLNLSKPEKTDLIAFLKTLTSNDQQVTLPILPN
jgi:cytochrome c peroxidase